MISNRISFMSKAEHGPKIVKNWPDAYTNESTADLSIYHHTVPHRCGIARVFRPYDVNTDLVSIAILYARTGSC